MTSCPRLANTFINKRCRHERGFKHATIEGSLTNFERRLRKVEDSGEASADFMRKHKIQKRMNAAEWIAAEKTCNNSSSSSGSDSSEEGTAPQKEAAPKRCR